MEHFSKNNPGLVDDGREGSISSVSSSNYDSAYSSHNGSASNVRQRASSYSPSYMNAKIPSRKPVGGQPPSGLSNSAVAANRQSVIPAPPAPKGTLLLAIAAVPHPSTIPYIQSMLKRRLYRQLILIGTAEYEAQLKELKMEIYAILGRLGKEVAVQMHLQSAFDEAALYTIVSKVVAEGDAIYGVLCTPSYSAAANPPLNVIQMDQESLQSSWKSSVAFLQTVAKQAIPNFRPSDHDPKQSGLFLVTGPMEDSPMSSINHAACRTIMGLLVEAGSAKGLVVDYAENALPPEPEVKEINDDSKLQALDVTVAAKSDDYPDPEPESPTKLWALYSELGAVE